MVGFDRNDTYIQSEGITRDLGIYDCPDDLLQEHSQAMSARPLFTRVWISCWRGQGYANLTI